MKTIKIILIPAVLFFILISTLIIDNCICQWQPDVQLTFEKPKKSFTEQYSFATNGEFLHLVWCDGREGLGQVYYKRSTDGGNSWSVDTKLTNNSEFSGFPCISVSGQVVHLIWYNYSDEKSGICYKRSTDGGTTWGTDTRLIGYESSNQLSLISVFEQVVHVVWCDNRDGNEEIYYKRSTDGGSTWGADTRISNSSADSKSPSISLSGLNVHIVWEDDSDKHSYICYKRSTDGGTNWETETQLKINSDKPNEPSISVSGSVGFVFWNDNREMNSQVYYKRSTDGGKSWGTDSRLTNDSIGSIRPSVFIYGSNVHITWSDFRDYNYEIYYKNSKDGGITWETDTRLTNSLGDSRFPLLSVSGKAVHIIWKDDRNKTWMDFDIYYKLNPTGNNLE